MISRDRCAFLSILSTLNLLLLLITSGCTAQDAGDVRSFVLPSNDPDVTESARELYNIILMELAESRSLEQGFPQAGQVAFEPDPAAPGAQTMHCAAIQDQPGNPGDCLLLNDRGDFLRVQSITFESAILFMYRVYIVPTGLMVSIDPAKDFVALDVFLLEEPTLWEAVDRTLRDILIAAGARPYAP